MRALKPCNLAAFRDQLASCLSLAFCESPGGRCTFSEFSGGKPGWLGLMTVVWPATEVPVGVGYRPQPPAADLAHTERVLLFPIASDCLSVHLSSCLSVSRTEIWKVLWLA